VKLNNTVMMGRLPGFLLYMGVVAEAKLVVLNQDELLLSRDPLEVDVWRVAREADIVNSTEIPSDECPGVNDELLTFQYFVLENGIEVPKLQQIQKVLDVFIDTMQLTNAREKWVQGSVIIRPYLNCFEQGEEFLVNALAKDHLRPPSVLPYNFSVPVEEVNTWGQYGQPAYIDEVFFKGQVKDGFFIEAGADDFETDSNTLLFELQHNWTGILVEPNPTIFPKGFSKQRKVWGSSTCLAIQPRPHVSPFSQKVTMGGMAGLVSEADEQSYDMQCFPLYSLILATGNRTVNYLSLDIEGAEFLVLKTIPWDKVDIEVISLETNHVGEVFPGSQREVREYLEERGYVMAATVEIDDIFVRRDLYEGKYSPDPEGETRYLSAGGSCVLSSSWKIEELQYVIQYYTQDRLFRIEL